MHNENFGNRPALKNELWKLLVNSGTSRTYRPGEYIFKKDQPSNGVICICKGVVKISSLSSKGSEKIYGIQSAPTVIGETETIDRGLRMVSASALTEAKISVVSREKIQELIEAHSEIAFFIIRAIGVKLRWTTRQAEDLSSHRIESRVARMILDFNKYGVFSKENDDSFLEITHEQLAHFVGAARPKVTYYLNEFEKKGLIELRRKHIRVINADLLQSYAEE